MAFGVFTHKDGWIYDDIPEVNYQLPKSYLSRAKQMVGNRTSICSGSRINFADSSTGSG